MLGHWDHRMTMEVRIKDCQIRQFTGQKPQGFIHGSDRSQDIVGIVFQD